jgi:ABC-type uncharacterized transport system substrate-binding protein
MTHRLIGLLVALGVLVAPLAPEAQQATKVYRVGWLTPGSRLGPNATLEPFRQGLHALGYHEGQNLVIEYRYAEGRDERLAALATELVQLKVDVIVAAGIAGIRAAQHATHTIPIVMTGVTDPVVQGFITSLARPEGNITGLGSLNEQLFGKRLEILKEIVPQSTRIAVLTNPAHSLHGYWMQDAPPNRGGSGARVTPGRRGSPPGGRVGRCLCRDDPSRRGRACCADRPSVTRGDRFFISRGRT